jgi:hypothetical protein
MNPGVFIACQTTVIPIMKDQYGLNPSRCGVGATNSCSSRSRYGKSDSRRATIYQISHPGVCFRHKPRPKSHHRGTLSPPPHQPPRPAADQNHGRVLPVQERRPDVLGTRAGALCLRRRPQEPHPEDRPPRPRPDARPWAEGDRGALRRADGEEYTDGTALVPRGSTVLVRWVAGSPAEAITVVSSPRSPPEATATSDPAVTSGSTAEDDEARAIIDAAELKWDSSSQGWRRYGHRGGLQGSPPAPRLGTCATGAASRGTSSSTAPPMAMQDTT